MQWKNLIQTLIKTSIYNSIVPLSQKRQENKHYLSVYFFKSAILGWIHNYIALDMKLDSKSLTVWVLCLTLALTLNLSPFEQIQTISQCDKHFEASNDYRFAICGSFDNLWAYSRNEAGDLVQSQTLIEGQYIVSATIRGSIAIGVIVRENMINNKLRIYLRKDITQDYSIVLEVQDVYKPTMYFLSKNAQLLIVSVNGKNTWYRLSQDKCRYTVEKVEDISPLSYQFVSLSEDESMMIRYKGPVEIYKKNDLGNYQLKVTLQTASQVPNFYLPSIAFLDECEIYIGVNIKRHDGTQEIQLFNYPGSGTRVFRLGKINYATSQNYEARSEISPNGKWVALSTTYRSINSTRFSFGEIHDNNSITFIQNHQYVANLRDFSFEQSGRREVFTLTSSGKTTVYMNQLECSQRPFSTGVQTSDGNCQCLMGYRWYQDQYDCLLLDCHKDISSTGLLLSNGQCKCKRFHFWTYETSECLPHCNVNLASHKDESDKKKCVCRGPSEWNQTTRQCQLNCPMTMYSSGQNEWDEVCECVRGSNWHPDTLTCDLNCTEIPESTGQFDPINNVCICKPDYQWITEKVICQRICIEDNLHTGQIQDGKCVCKEGAKWDCNTQTCVLIDCDEIFYSIGFGGDNGTNDSCICETDFYWDSNQYLCVLQCDEILDELSAGTNLDSYQCNCLPVARWDTTARRCTLRCNLITYSTGFNINSDECQCELGYIWQASNYSCNTKCGTRVGETGVFLEGQNHCQCAPQFFWSAYNSACYRDCAAISNAYHYQGPSPDSCSCYAGYTWNSTSTSCSLQCNGYFDVGTVTGNQCDCETNSIWIGSYAKCMIQCNNDDLSSGIFTVDRCVCKANSVWNAISNACECIGGFKKNDQTSNCVLDSPSLTAGVSLGVIGGSIVSGSLIFLGLHIRNKRKKKANQEVVSKDPNQQIVETAEDLKDNENI